MVVELEVLLFELFDPLLHIVKVCGSRIDLWEIRETGLVGSRMVDYGMGLNVELLAVMDQRHEPQRLRGFRGLSDDSL